MQFSTAAIQVMCTQSHEGTMLPKENIITKLRQQKIGSHEIFPNVNLLTNLSLKYWWREKWTSINLN